MPGMFVRLGTTCAKGSVLVDRLLLKIWQVLSLQGTHLDVAALEDALVENQRLSDEAWL